jgi:UDP-N-acetylglucosamine--N-acetylmuramyl-(pentapeptide) pyrophosphoryl-undecaprenol N-acetylglucosamine transferase
MFVEPRGLTAFGPSDPGVTNAPENTGGQAGRGTPGDQGARPEPRHSPSQRPSLSPQQATPSPAGSACVVFAGGGTAGHIYPAIAIAEELTAEQHPDLPAVRPHFICSTRRLDAQVLAGEGLPYAALPAAPFGGGIKGMVGFARAWRRSVKASTELLRQERAAVVVAMGGFVCAPVAAAAAKLGVPVLLINLDGVAGKANRVAAKHANHRLSTASGPRVPDEWTQIRPIVRSAAIARETPEQCRNRFNLYTDRPTLLVMGGSQGAASINNFMIHYAQTMAQRLDREHPDGRGAWQVLHIAGPNRSAPVAQAYRAAAICSTVVDYCDDMAVAWGAANIALCRAGANTVAEAWANAVPCLFMPYPYHKDQHQAVNAKPLVRAGGSELFEDHVTPKKNAQSVGKRLSELLANDTPVSGMAANIRLLGPTDGAASAAQSIRNMLASSHLRF